MKLERIVSLSLAALLVISSLAACGKKDEDASKTDAKITQATVSGKIDKITLPITSQNIKLKYWVSTDSKYTPFMQTFADSEGVKELMKRTGITLEYIHPALKQEVDSFNLMIATNDLPDIIDFNWLVTAQVAGGAAKYLASEHIIKLNDEISKYAPNFRKILENDADFKKQASTEDGTLYMFPGVRLDPYVNATSGFQIRKDWLDKVGLQEPKTLDDWYKVLTAFLNNDPNGNGKKDEVPYTGQGNQAGKGIRALDYFAPAFGITIGGCLDASGKMVYGPMQPAYKDYLTLMAKWYKEKLIDQDIVVNDSKALDSKVMNDQTGSYWGKAIGNLQKYLAAMETTSPKFKLIGVAYPIGPAGKAYTNWDLKTKIPFGGAAITKANKFVKETVMLLDYGYSEEGQLLGNYGLDGKTYTMVNGKPKLTEMGLKVYNDGTKDILQKYCSLLPGIGIDITKDDPSLNKYQEVVKARQLWAQADAGLITPKVTLGDSDSQKLNQIMGQVNTYQEEMMAKFILGKEPIENFDKYVQTLKGMNIEEALKINNAAIEKYNKR